MGLKSRPRKRRRRLPRWLSFDARHAAGEVGARRRQLSTLKFVTNHRGLRLTNLEEMSTGMHVEEKRSRHESVIESGSETTGGVAPYVEMLD